MGKDLAVAVYDSHSKADEAIRQLQRSGFDVKSLSIIGKDYHTEEHAIGFYNSGDRMRVWGKRGAFWGGLAGILFSPALFLIPGIGHLIIMGPFVSTLLGGLEGAAVGGGVGALAGALVSIGIPKDSVVRYETHIGAGKYLVVAHGTAEQVAQAHAILGAGSIEATTYQA